jgi:hypothetical protein
MQDQAPASAGESGTEGPRHELTGDYERSDGQFFSVALARVAEPSPDAGAAVRRELRHRCAGLPAQLACDADLRAAGTITALGAHDPRRWRAGPRMRP